MTSRTRKKNATGGRPLDDLEGGKRHRQAEVGGVA